MEISARNATRLLCLLVTFHLFSLVRADGVIKQITDPTGNVNLSPFQQWKSAYECLQNKSHSCSDKYTLTEAGWMNVTAADRREFCVAGRCGEHTQAVLTCIHLVKRDYKFANKATVQELYLTITNGCAFGFNGTTTTNGARRTSKAGITTFLILILPVLFLSVYFNG